MAKHSPGPWRADYAVGGALGIWSRGYNADWPDVCVVSSVPNATDEANGRLIAAAPELLAACKALDAAPHFDHFAARLNDEEMAALIAIRAAVAKAEGA